MGSPADSAADFSLLLTLKVPQRMRFLLATLAHAARLLVSLAYITSITSCGSKTETIKVKDYRLYLVDRVLSLETEFKRLITAFNREAKLQVLMYEPKPEDANSAIVVTKGLKDKTDGKVGLGQWIAQTDLSRTLSFSNQNTQSETIRYSMRLEFDAEYFQTRIGNDDPVKRYEKQKLFFHEVGHGLEMDHEPEDSRNVMYPNVSGDKDFEAFFERVRAYMKDASAS